jgi:hypothetical protein
MNLRELAESDLAFTLEDVNGAGTPFTLISPDGGEFPVVGTVGDIGVLFAPETGEAIRTRSIAATCRIRTLAALTALMPERGWKAAVLDLQGNMQSLYVQGNDPDRTLGVYHLRMGLNLNEEGESDE